eukprot:9397474-Alexandrium_andersonii.AAC.1
MCIRDRAEDTARRIHYGSADAFASSVRTEMCSALAFGPRVTDRAGYPIFCCLQADCDRKKSMGGLERSQPRF